ncbi:arsenate reductase family protein [Psychrobacillus soli]|uniref:Arsenate reductase family protein n=1 Tax=Psychrobacillus soli TaxID=1543965 RepID=A0A544SVS4_9BACI|nr:arsenate reductase family protein [Psychrobacillus soli]TQR09304.1 arsenate reductase family protein [Psychrobacillus soli]
MTIQFFGYPKCSSCNKASKWLKNHEVEFVQHHIVETPPSKELIKEMLTASGLELKKFFNTSGTKYRELQLKEKLPNMTEEEQIEMLVSDGMLVKRPLVFDGKHLTLGFKEEEFEHIWTNN